MGKVNGLIKNELIKQYKKVSVKVIVILILLLSLLLPFGVKFLQQLGNDDWYIENYKNQISYLDMNMQSIENSNKKGDMLQKRYYEAEKKQYNLLIDNKISYEDWRSESASQWVEKETESIAIEAMLEGYDKETILTHSYSLAEEDVTRYFEMPKEELQGTLDKVNKEKTSIEEAIIKNDYIKFLDSSIALSKESIEQQKKEIVVMEEQLKNEPQNKELGKAIESSKLQLAMTEERLQATQYRYDNKIPYDNGDWRNLTIKDLAYKIDSKGQPVLSEEEFNQQYMYQISKGVTYESYKKTYEENQQKISESIALDWYSLETNVPQIDFHKDARSSVDTIYLIYVSVAIILCVIIAGGIVSSEYSTGTIRLLMIRPVTRWKILFSKLSAVFIIGYTTLISTVLLVIFSSGLLYGFGGFSTKILAYSGGAIVEKSYLISIIPKLLFSSISLIFIIALAFAISTIIKNTALAVGLTIVMYLGASPATLVMANLKMTWVSKTILPYMNLSSFHMSPYYVNMLKEQYNIILNPNMGAIQLAILAVILVAISFAIFVKRDVKN